MAYPMTPDPVTDRPDRDGGLWLCQDCWMEVDDLDYFPEVTYDDDDNEFCDECGEFSAVALHISPEA